MKYPTQASSFKLREFGRAVFSKYPGEYVSDLLYIRIHLCPLKISGVTRIIKQLKIEKMKRILLSLFSLTVILLMVQAQNDTMYVISNGVSIGKHKVTEVDSITFYNPASSPSESLNVESSKFLNMVISAADYIDANQMLPLIVYTDASETIKVNTAEFYFMMAKWIRWFKNNGEGATPPLDMMIVRGIDGPSVPSGEASGTFLKDDMLTKGKSNADFIETNNYVPNYSTIGSTKYLPEALFYAMAKTIRWYVQNSNSFPTSINITSVAAPSTWISSTGGLSGSYSWSKTLSVPYTAQPDSHTCGPTSLKMGMDYYGTSKTLTEICDYMTSIGDNTNDGVSGSTIASTAINFGFSSTTIQYGLTNLKNAIANGHPAIVAIRIKSNEYPLYYPSDAPVYTTYNGGHFLVIIGLQAADDGSVEYVIANDPMVPSGANLKYTWDSFDTSWINNSNRYMIRLE